MRQTPQRGFSLVELLVVVVILGLLLALLLPSFGAVWRQADMSRCTANLYHIGQAFRMRLADEAAGRANDFQPRGWVAALSPYLGGDSSQFICPSAGVEGTFDIAVIDITELVEFRVKSGIYTTQLEPGPFMLKLSDTQWNTARSMNLLGNLDDANNITTRHPEFNTYVPDGNPYRYWLCMEDHGGDQDFKDVMTRVTDNGNGTITVECISGFTTNTNSLMDKLTGAVLFDTGSNQWNFSASRTVVLDVGGASTSYGMNEYGRDVRGGGKKILVMDYHRYLACPTDLWNDEKADPDGDGKPSFARHFGQINILWLDGSVQAEWPTVIDPVTPSVAAQYWKP